MKRTDIKKLMESKGVSADQLARELKVTTQTVYNLRAGKSTEQMYDHALIVLKGWANK